MSVGLGAEEPASHLQNELRSHSFPMYILVSPALGNHSVQPLPYQPSAGISAQPENPTHLPGAKGSQEPSPKSAVCADGQWGERRTLACTGGPLSTRHWPKHLLTNRVRNI